MGLFLRYNLFYRVTHDSVYASYARFYAERHQPLQSSGNDAFKLTIHETHNDWVVLALDRGWEREVRQAAYLYTSQQLACPGLFVYVYDGLHWGYELFARGSVLDQFVSHVEPEGVAYCDEIESCGGNAGLIAAEFPHLTEQDVAPYLVRKPILMAGEKPLEYMERKKHLDVLPRPGDQYTRFDPCAVLNFLRVLGIQVEVRGNYVTLLTPEYRSFWVKYQQYRSEVQN